MTTDAEILAKLNDLLGKYGAAFEVVGQNKALVLDRVAAASEAVVVHRAGGDERFRSGLIGTDDWRLQRSINGTAGGYQDVLTVDRATGQVALAGALAVGGLDVAGNVGIGKTPGEKLDVDGYARAKGFYTADVLIQTGTAATIPTPSSSGIVMITNQPTSAYPQSAYSGFALFDAGLTPDIIRLGGGASFYTINGDVTGTTGADPGVTVGIVTGSLKIENRFAGAMTFRYTIIG